MASAADKLREAGFRVLEGDGVWKLKAPDAGDRASWDEVRLNADGTPVLIKARSALHRQIASVLGC